MMDHPRITRRQFTAFLAAGLLLGRPGRSRAGEAPEPSPRRLRAAAIQMSPALGDVQANLGQAEQLVREALGRGAEWIILPEYFTSAAAFHPRLLDAIQPPDGAALRLLRDLARQGNAVVGGSFMAQRDGRVYNSFVLALPDGSTARHDKDAPTYWENCYCQGAEPGDDGVLPSPIGPVGAGLCWELIRTRTAARLLGRVQLVVGGSCCWTLPDDADTDSPLRAVNLKMLQQTPVRFARLLGVPVIHGSHAGRFAGFFSPDLPDVPYDSSYLGEAMIVDGAGEVLARRGLEQGAGVVIADVLLPAKPRPLDSLPQRFWIPEEMPQPWKDSWERWFEPGSLYYETVTLPYLETGELNEYVPAWMSGSHPVTAPAKS